MGIRIGWWTLDVEDAVAEARFWEQLLGWPRLFEDESEGIALTPVLPPVWGQGLLLYAHHTTGPKQVKNRAHLDLRPADQSAVVGRALELGASRADVGQGVVSWEVLTDPEGNEFCVLSDIGDGGVEEGVAIEEVTIDANDVPRTAAFWQELLGWEEVDRDRYSVELRDPAGSAWNLLILHTPDHKMVKNRMHPDLLPIAEEGDEEARQVEIERAVSLGATFADIGQGDVGWTVLADPDGNEFCVLRPRGV